MDGSLAISPKEVASIFSSHFSILCGRHPTFDSSILDLLPKVPHNPNLDAPPSDDEILQAINKLHSTSPIASNVYGRLWQALSSTLAGFAFIRHFVVHFWLTKAPLAIWELGVLSILPKNGDLHSPRNYRSITMLEVAYTIVANILYKRL